MTDPSQNRVAVAMSGGVDSSISAILLKNQGYKVIGLTMKLWDCETLEDLELPEKICCAPQDIDDAKNIAARFDFPHIVVDLSKEFRGLVEDPFYTTYIKGMTPSPCIICNKKIKFQLLWEKARTLGANYLATGHYANIKKDIATKRLFLSRAPDLSKDQSYFLFSLSQLQLSRSLFPVGNYNKSKTKEIAQYLNLKVHEKSESQETCFTFGDKYSSILEKRFPDLSNKGSFVDKKGNVIGQHEGIHLYTIGQRRGLNISLGKPAYVIKINPTDNTIVLGNERDLLKDKFYIEDLNFMKLDSFDDINSNEEVFVKIRSTHKPTPCTVKRSKKSSLKVMLNVPQRAITPGQAAVFYNKQGDILAGGWITK